MPRPRTGTLLPKRKDGFYSAKVWVTRDGKPVRETVDLGTRVKALAEQRLAELVNGEHAAPPTKREAETFAKAAARVNDQREADGVHAHADEWQRLKKWAIPAFGDERIDRVSPAHINAALDAVKKDGLSRQTAAHLLNAIRQVFTGLIREGAIEVNPANLDAVLMPRFPPTTKKERAVLNDAELSAYLRWEHPIPEHRISVLERQCMALLARTFGGLRTGDLHSLRWDGFDLPAPDNHEPHGFVWGVAPRQKTRRPQRLAVPIEGRLALWEWWVATGRERTGLVFPSRRGDRKGEAKTKVSHAKAFRRDLRRAWGIERWDERKGAFVDAREPTERERVVLEGDRYTLPVDWHSWRRAYSQALADAGVNAQDASALAGHASLAAHQRYLMRSEKTFEAPSKAMPRLILGVSEGQSATETKPADLTEATPENSNDFSGADGTRTRDSA